MIIPIIDRTSGFFVLVGLGSVHATDLASPGFVRGPITLSTLDLYSRRGGGVVVVRVGGERGREREGKGRGGLGSGWGGSVVAKGAAGRRGEGGERVGVLGSAGRRRRERGGWGRRGGRGEE